MTRLAGVTFLATLLILSGCGTEPDQQTPLSSTPPPSSPEAASVSPPVTTDEGLALSQYRRYWQIETPAFNAAPAQQRELLSAVMRDPALSAMIKLAAQVKKSGREVYGESKPRPKVQSRDRQFIVIVDCQDSTKNGQYNPQTKKYETAGVARHVVEASMVKGRDGVWRIAGLNFPEDKRC